MRYPDVNVGFVLTLIAVIIFALVAFGVAISGVQLLALGLAFFAAGHLF